MIEDQLRKHDLRDPTRDDYDAKYGLDSLLGVNGIVKELRYESKLIEDTKPKFHTKGEQNHKGIQQVEDVGFIETEED